MADEAAQALQDALDRIERQKIELIQAKAEAQVDKAAIIAEFASLNNVEEAVNKARKFIEDTLPEAIITMRELIASAESESVRASLSKYVVDTVLTKKIEDTDNHNSEIKTLLAQLTIAER